MAQKRILIKLPNGSIRPFSERAAKIAVESLGGIEMTPPDKPPELNVKIKIPPQITQPIPLKTVEKPAELEKKTVKVEPVIAEKIEIKQEDIAEKFEVPVKKRGGRKSTKK